MSPKTRSASSSSRPARVRTPLSLPRMRSWTRSGSSRRSHPERRRHECTDSRRRVKGDPGVRERAAMNTARLGLAAAGARLALAVPTVAQANEVTNWNNIAVTTLLVQPPVASQPPAAAVFMAMVQGAVYGAANAVDRQGRPYLVNRSFPKASLDAAVATAAFH